MLLVSVVNMVLLGGKKSVLDGAKLQLNDEMEEAFAKIYEEQKKAVRFPEEINVQQDAADYQAMSDHERKVFNHLVSYFVGTELLVQNVLGDTFYSHIASPRAKMGLSVQMFMEAIHNDFFEMVLNSFNMDQEAMYRHTETNPTLLKKRELVAGAADSISATYGDIDADTLEGKKAILHAILINNIIQEGIFFYSSFAMFFAMRDTGKMQNVCNGIDLILIDESLHLKMGMEMIFAILQQEPAIMDDADFVQKIQDTLKEGVEIELEFLKQLFDDGITFGVSYKEMEHYLKYIADRRLEELGFAPNYNIDDNPLKFLEKQDVMTLQNFFEVTPNQYTNY